METITLNANQVASFYLICYPPEHSLDRAYEILTDLIELVYETGFRNGITYMEERE